MLVKWFFLYLREARAYLDKLYRLIFTPSAYARSLALDDERSFRKSINFFLASASSYIAIASLLQKFDGDHVLLQNFSQDFIAFARLMINLLVWSMLNFLVICLLLRRRLSFSDFFHCSLHITIIGMVLHLYSIITTSIATPPMSDMAFAIISDLPAPNPVTDMCLADKDHMSCRSLAASFHFAVGFTKTLNNFGLLGNGEDAVSSAAMTGMTIYFVLMALALFLPFGWCFHAQASIISAALNVPRLRTIVALLAVNVMVITVYLSFPPIMEALSGSAFSRQTQELWHFLGQ